ncbi:MAG: hypothetical protein CMD20_01260 [Flavobacteriales bacterium]|nr:hypothetical protein [Flavobacteriales bacterium]
MDYKRVLKYTKQLLKEVKPKFQNWDVLINAENQRRMRGYILIQTLWTAGFCLLRGERIKDNELKAIVNISALAPLYDDFFDKVEMPSQKIHALVNTPFYYKPDSEIEMLFLEFSKRIHENVHDVPFYLENAENVFKAQYESKKLVSENLLDRDFVREVAFNKGGKTVICMCNLLNEKLSNEEYKLMHQLGGVAQYLDDIFDLREDYLEGRQTLANPIQNASSLKRSFLDEIKNFKRNLEISAYTKSDKMAFFVPISYILGATLLCTRRYELLERKTNGEFKIEEYSREDLVVDMDLWSNRIKAFKLSLTL